VPSGDRVSGCALVKGLQETHDPLLLSDSWCAARPGGPLRFGGLAELPRHNLSQTDLVDHRGQATRPTGGGPLIVSRFKISRAVAEPAV